MSLFLDLELEHYSMQTADIACNAIVLQHTWLTPAIGQLELEQDSSQAVL